MTRESQPEGRPSGLTRKLLLNCTLPEPKLVERVEVREITIAARQAAGAHRHPCPVFGQILAGQIRFQVEGEEARTLSPGDVFYEPAHTPILHFDAVDEAATFMAYFPLGPGEENVLEML